MARKSRKETAAVAVQEADAACRAAIYVRLSVEDTHTHSVSIETQQMIIARYLEQYPEISVYDTYPVSSCTPKPVHWVGCVHAVNWNPPSISQRHHHPSDGR